MLWMREFPAHGSAAPSRSVKPFRSSCQRPPKPVIGTDCTGQKEEAPFPGDERHGKRGFSYELIGHDWSCAQPCSSNCGVRSAHPDGEECALLKDRLAAGFWSRLYTYSSISIPSDQMTASSRFFSWFASTTPRNSLRRDWSTVCTCSQSARACVLVVPTASGTGSTSTWTWIRLGCLFSEVVR